MATDLKRNPPRHIIGYFKDPTTWDAIAFETAIRAEIEATYGSISSSDESLIGSLMMVMDSLMISQQTINQEGFITNYGQNVGTTPWVKLRNESIDKLIKILGELGLVARGRPKKVNKATEVDELFAVA